MAEKHVFGDVYLHNLFIYTQICLRGQQVVFSYPMVSYKIPTTLMTPYSYPMGNLSYSFMNKNGQKRLKKCFLMMLTSITSYSTHKYFLRVLIGIRLSYGISQGGTKLISPYSYLAGHCSHSLVSKNGWKRMKNMFWWCLPPFMMITSYSTHKYVLWANEWCSVILF
jgi:hypothetical protein